jgi:hypothetical protein
MRKIQILGAFVAVVAFNALAVSSASATLWLNPSTGKSVLTATAATAHGTVEFHHVVLTVETVFRCSVLFLGTVGGPNGTEDLINLFHSLSGTSSEDDLIICESVQNCNKPIQHVEKLPWSTGLLLLSNGITDDHFFSDGHGEPALEILCEGGLKTLCESLINAEFDKNLANGALFLFTKAGTVTKGCSDGGETWITGMIEVLGFNVS